MKDDLCVANWYACATADDAPIKKYTKQLIIERVLVFGYCRVIVLYCLVVLFEYFCWSSSRLTVALKSIIECVMDRVDNSYKKKS